VRTFLDRWYVLGPSAALLVFLSLVALSYKDWRDYLVARIDIDEAQDVVEQAYALVHSLDDAETEQREYVRTGDEQFPGLQFPWSLYGLSPSLVVRSTEQNVQP
jgi:hypothetical protein